MCDLVSTMSCTSQQPDKQTNADHSQLQAAVPREKHVWVSDTLTLFQPELHLSTDSQPDRQAKLTPDSMLTCGYTCLKMIMIIIRITTKARTSQAKVHVEQV